MKRVFLSPGEAAKECGYSKSHLRLLTNRGAAELGPKVPGAVKKQSRCEGKNLKGKHWVYLKCPAWNRWASERRNELALRKMNSITRADYARACRKEKLLEKEAKIQPERLLLAGLDTRVSYLALRLTKDPSWISEYDCSLLQESIQRTIETLNLAMVRLQERGLFPKTVLKTLDAADSGNAS